MVNEHGDSPDVAMAVKTVMNSRDVHVRWQFYLAKGGMAPAEIGDEAYHRGVADEYQNVLECLLLLQGLINLAEGKVKPIEQIREELAKSKRAL